MSSGSLTQNATERGFRAWRDAPSFATASARTSSSGDERVPGGSTRSPSRRASRASSAGGHDDGERSAPLEPVPQADEPERCEDRDREPERHEPIRGEPPVDERERHADERERRTTSAGSGRRCRSARVKPTTASGTETHSTYRRPAVDEAVEVRAPQLGRQAGTSQERVLRRVDLQGRRSRSHGQSPIPSTAPPPSGGRRQSGTPRAGRSATRGRPRRAGSRRQSRRNWGWARPPPRVRTRPGRPPGVWDRPAARPPRGTPPRVIRFATYPAARWTANVPASSPASAHPPALVRRRTRPRPRDRPPPPARPRAPRSPARPRARAVPSSTSDSAGAPGSVRRSPTGPRRPRAGTTRGRPARRDPPGTRAPRATNGQRNHASRTEGEARESGTRRSCSPALGAPSGP